MFDWCANDVSEVEARRAISRTANEHPVAFYGSSSIRLWTSLADDFAGTPVINLGFGGSTLAACAFFFERIVLPVAPRSLVLYAGDNDLGDGRTPDAIIGSLCDLLAKIDLSLPGIPVGFISVKPSLARWNSLGDVRSVNAQAWNIFDARPGGVYLDVFSSMLSDSGGPRPELFEPDGLHLNRLGYRLWWQVVAAHRAELRL